MICKRFHLGTGKQPGSDGGSVQHSSQNASNLNVKCLRRSQRAGSYRPDGVPKIEDEIDH